MSHKFIQSIIIGVCCMFLLGACSSPSSEPRERLSFNDGWCFSLIDAATDSVHKKNDISSYR